MDASTAVVIEDDHDIAGLISFTLRRSGFTVHCAATGPDGVEAARTFEPALVTADVNLPGFNGLEAVRQIRAFSNPVILVVSANDSFDDRQKAQLAGADDYITKPFSPRKLRALVESLMS